MFQAIYVLLWYAAVNQLAAADYMGTVLVNGRPGRTPLVVHLSGSCEPTPARVQSPSAGQGGSEET